MSGKRLWDKGIALDETYDRIYWTDTAEGAIRWMPMNAPLASGSTVSYTLASGFTNLLWIAIDEANREAYVIESSQVYDSAPRALRRVNLDGEPLVETVLSGLFNFDENDPFWWLVTGLAVDKENRRIYWSEAETMEVPRGRISWVEPDGANWAALVQQSEDHVIVHERLV